MENILYKVSLCLLVTCFFTGLDGQDPQFSQFYNSSLYYNPATAGISQDLRFSSSYRNLWSNIPGNISTYYVSGDYQWTHKNVGIGFLMMSDNEGIHNLKTQRFELMYSYRLQSKYRMLQFGMSAFSINIRGLQNKEFVFSDQLDPIYGVIQPSSFVHDKMENKVYPDWNVGFVYRQNFKHHKATQTVGFSASHVLRPNISLTNEKVRLPIRYVLHSSFLTRVAFNKSILWDRKFVFIYPGFVYEYQEPFQTFTLGSGFDSYPFRFGMWFRKRSFLNEIYKFNSIVIHAGMILPVSLNHNIMIDYTYDSTVSKLDFASGGAHEITLIYNISLPDKPRAVDCTPFFEWWRVGKGLQHYPNK